MTILGHFARAQTIGTWITGYVPQITDWKSFDARSAQAVNGDDGGTWAPADSNPIIINGSGLVVTGPSLISGNGANLTSLAVGAFHLSGSEWPVLGPTHTSRSRTIVSSTLRSMSSLARTGPSLAASILPNTAYASPQTVLVPGSTVVLQVTLRCHDGSTLDSVSVNWIVSWSHTPVTLPRFRVLRVDPFGNATPMSSAAVGADADGYFTPPSTGWSHPGTAQTFEIPVDTVNTISLANYEYVLEIDEEQGVTGFPWSATCFAQSCSYVDTSGQVTPTGVVQVIDGVTVSATSTYVLLTNQLDPTQNGLWLVETGSWTRVTLPKGGAIFWVQQGNQLSNTYWQMPALSGNSIPLWLASTPYAKTATVAPVANTTGFGLVAVCTTNGTSSASEPTWPSVAGQTVTDNTVVWTMQQNAQQVANITPLKDPLHLNTGCLGGFACFGNIWLPVACKFSNIVDCRWD
jgi:hypothetical protein